MYVQKVYLPSSFTKCIENCGLPDFVTDYQIRHLGNPFGLPEILLKIDPCDIILPLGITAGRTRILPTTELNKLPLLIKEYCA